MSQNDQYEYLLSRPKLVILSLSQEIDCTDLNGKFFVWQLSRKLS